MAKKSFEVALILSASDKASRVISGMTANAEKRIGSLSKMGDKAFAFGRGAAVFGGGIIAGLGLTVKAAEDSEIANRRLESTFKTMGETTNQAAKEAEDYASKLQMQIGVEDEEIQMVQSKLATFKRVSDEGARASGVFNRATAAAYDLQAAGFGEASQNAVLLGKALQDPAKGATALARTGALNKSDIPLIKQIQATKGLGAAQEYVLKKVEAQVKGQAVNTATSANKMKVTFAEVAETLGKTLLPQVQKIMTQVGDAANRFNAWSQRNSGLVSTITGVVGKVGLLSLAVSGLSFVFGGLFKVIAFGMNIYKLARVASIAYTAATAAGAGITGGMTAAVTALNLAFLANPITWIIIGIVALVAAGYLLIKNWSKVSAFFSNLWAGIKTMFSNAWNWIKNIFLNYTPHGLIIKHWDKISGFFTGLWDKVKKIFLGFINGILFLPKTFLKLGVDIISGLWNGIKAKATALFDYVKGIGSKIASTFKNVLGIASPSKVFMDYGVNITEGAKKGIEKGSPSLAAASGGMAKGIKPVSSGGRSTGGGGMTINFAPVISAGGNSQDILSQLKAYTPQLIREIEAALERKKRLSY